MTFFAIIVLYGLFLVIGWWASRRVRSGSTTDMLLAGRAMPLWIATMTMTATWVDGGYLLGTTEAVYKSSLSLGVQGGLCFGLSLILGGFFFAAPMRRAEYTTLIDPFEERFGPVWAAVLSLPAVLAEIFWSAELLVAIGTTFGVLLDVNLVTAIVVSAVIVTAYTMAGGLWAVAYTDAVQLGLVFLGLAAALPYALDAAGGLGASWSAYMAARGERGLLPPPWPMGNYWTWPTFVSWWDVALMLMLGGIPWNCYFQRVLACRDAGVARWHSWIAGFLTIALTAPPLLLGVAAFHYQWPPDVAQRLQAQPADALPMVLQYLTPPFVAFLGLAAIVGAVTSSYSASILSAGAMLTWNFFHRLGLLKSVQPLTAVTRILLVLLSAAAVVLALKVQSVQALWFFTSDLVFVLLFPQLVFALFDRRANRIGSMAAFFVSLGLRLGGGEPLFHLPEILPYSTLCARWLPGNPQDWYDASTGTSLFPVRTVAAAAGLVLLPVVSRLTARWNPPRA